jgi:hypothetical protein
MELVADNGGVQRKRKRLSRRLTFLKARPHWSGTTLYKAAKKHPGLIVKNGRSSFVNEDMADAVEADWPAKP